MQIWVTCLRDAFVLLIFSARLFAESVDQYKIEKDEIYETTPILTEENIPLLIEEWHRLTEHLAAIDFSRLSDDERKRYAHLFEIKLNLLLAREAAIENLVPLYKGKKVSELWDWNFDQEVSFGWRERYRFAKKEIKMALRSVVALGVVLGLVRFSSVSSLQTALALLCVSVLPAVAAGIYGANALSLLARAPSETLIHRFERLRDLYFTKKTFLNRTRMAVEQKDLDAIDKMPTPKWGYLVRSYIVGRVEYELWDVEPFRSALVNFGSKIAIGDIGKFLAEIILRQREFNLLPLQTDDGLSQIALRRMVEGDENARSIFAAFFKPDSEFKVVIEELRRDLDSGLRIAKINFSGEMANGEKVHITIPVCHHCDLGATFERHIDILSKAEWLSPLKTFCESVVGRLATAH